MKRALLASLFLCILPSKTSFCGDHSETAEEKTGHSTAPEPELALSEFPKCALSEKRWEAFEGVQLVAAFIKKGTGPLMPSNQGDKTGECALIAVKDKIILGAVQIRNNLADLNKYSVFPPEMSGEIGNVILLPTANPNLPQEPIQAPCQAQDIEPQLLYRRAKDGKQDKYVFGKAPINEPIDSEDPNS